MHGSMMWLKIIILILTNMLEVSALSFDLYLACRPEDGFHFCSSTGKCIKRSALFERECKTDSIACSDEEIRCRVVKRCVPRRFLNTAEGCLLNNKERILLPCRSDEFTCEKSRLCIPRWAVHSGEIDCRTKEFDDDSDETGDPLHDCSIMEFRCPGTRRCIPREWILDGNTDCLSTGTDEDKPLPNCCSNVEFRCQSNGRCIRRYRVMDGFSDCNDDSDEQEAISNCTDAEFRCVDSGRCIPRAWMLDGTDNCKDSSDEIPNRHKCLPHEYSCHNKRRCIDPKYLCDGMDHCGDCSDEIEGCDEPRMWRCPGDPLRTCIPQSYACDAFGDCPNGRDNPSYLPGFKCNGIALATEVERCAIPQWTLHDENAICQDESDLCFVNQTFHCARCVSDETIIAKGQVCDGFIDCKDFSDECLCNSERAVEDLCRLVCYDNAPSRACDHCLPGEIHCDNASRCLDRSKMCDGIIDCPSSEIDEKFCTEKESEDAKGTQEKNFACDPVPAQLVEAINKRGLQALYDNMIPQNATRCDGVIECARFEDECSAGCENVMEECQKFKTKRISIIERVIGARVPFNIRACSDFDTQDDLTDFLGFVVGFSICNGVSECSDNADEENCRDRFNCDAGTIVWPTGVKKIVSIEEKKLCDLTADCADAIDEMDCNSSKHFYCTGGDPLFVHSDLVMDGRQDCYDNSDECPPYAYDDNPFSSREEMISNEFLRFFIWVTAFFAVSGNVVVILEALLGQGRSLPRSSMSKCNQILLINLATSDFLMGVALTMITAKSLLFSGRYCLADKEWRVSGLCNGIGVFVLLSSETSVFTLVALTFYRLYGVILPLESRNVKSRTALFAAMSTWLFSGILATIPLIPNANQSMITKALIEPSVYFRSTKVSWTDMQTFAVRLFTSGNRTLANSQDFSTWNKVENNLKKFYPDYAPIVLGYFGYYSTHGVCIPRLFRSDGTPPLHILSLFIISLNFCSLIFIIVAYCLIYRKSTRSKEAVGQLAIQGHVSRKMQNKITILIATDLCCWLPICIMTVLSLSGISVTGVGYAIAAIVFLPINSAVNPCIYSNGFAVVRSRISQSCENINRLARSRRSKSKTENMQPAGIHMQSVQSTNTG